MTLVIFYRFYGYQKYKGILQTTLCHVNKLEEKKHIILINEGKDLTKSNIQHYFLKNKNFQQAHTKRGFPQPEKINYL